MKKPKKSLSIAMEEARELSAKFPSDTVRVMDKKCQKVVVCNSEWVYRERVLAGWFTIATFCDGKQCSGEEI